MQAEAAFQQLTDSDAHTCSFESFNTKGHANQLEFFNDFSAVVCKSFIKLIYIGVECVGSHCLPLRERFSIKTSRRRRRRWRGHFIDIAFESSQQWCSESLIYGGRCSCKGIFSDMLWCIAVVWSSDVTVNSVGVGTFRSFLIILNRIRIH